MPCGILGSLCRNLHLCKKIIKFILKTRRLWAEFSLKYSTKTLKFVEVNVVKNKKIAEEFSINTSGVSRQLPTLIMFEDGVEVCRFPEINDEGKIGKVLKYDKRELAKFFDLENRYFETFSL